MSKHTPLPWHKGQGNGEGSIFAKEGRMRMEDRGTTLYPICSVIDFDGERDANAEFIVRACNCHEELLAACKAFLKIFEDGTHYDTRNPYTRPEVKAAVAAITKAEGKADA